MRVKQTHRRLFILGFLLCCVMGFSQNNKQQALENRRQEILRDIKMFNSLQSENRSKKQSELSKIEDFNYKINVLNNLIKVTNQQANYLTREINNNQKKVTDLRDELKQLKADYAAMIVKSYKSKNQQSRLMFLLSSDDFKQAYKRLQYIKQYASHQKKQGEMIKAKTQELQEINKDLLKQKEAKNALIAENRKTQRELEADRAEHQKLMNAINQRMSKITSEIRAKQQEADRIEKQINDIIKAEIAKSNAKAGKSTSSTSFSLTPEEKLLASNFEANKGKLPWPVEKGFVRLGYGRQPSLINKSLIVERNGVLIATEKGAEVRSVYDGVVSRIIMIKNAYPVVVIRHGNYMTAYRNVINIRVKEGEKVSTKEVIGDVATNPATGETLLSFIVYKDSKTQNPASWINHM